MNFRILEMRGISKRFGELVANDNVSLTLRAGEVLGLLGENGAGKSTLMNVLFGLYQPDAGQVLLNGEPVRLTSPREALRHGIGMVHQHFMLVPTHTVAENIALSLPRVPFWNPELLVRERLREFCGEYGFHVDPEALIQNLSAGEQQRVEILKALLGGAEVLILDEPTSVLTPREADELMIVLAKMTKKGHGIIFITHKLEEILAVSQRIHVLRHGKTAGEVKTAMTSREELVRLMVGQDIDEQLPRREMPMSAPVLEIKEVSVIGDSGRIMVQQVSFEVRRGEIFGIAGVSGNGQKELVEAIAGLRPPHAGDIRLEGRSLVGCSPREIAEAGLAHVPEERLKSGVVGAMTLAENAVLKTYAAPPVSVMGLLQAPRMREIAEELVTEFQVQPPVIDQPIRRLSGGNIQKFLLGRELKAARTALLAAHPTYGVDIGAATFIRRQLLELRERGCGILLVSEDLEEIFALADRIAVFFEGRCVGVRRREETTRGEIGLMMAGGTA